MVQRTLYSLYADFELARARARAYGGSGGETLAHQPTIYRTTTAGANGLQQLAWCRTAVRQL